jgi:hypothetical protein
MRDKGGSSRRSDRETENFQKSSGYTKYKSELDRLFSGGAPLPEHLREKSDPADVERDEERKKLFAIEDPKAFHAAAKAFLEKHALPDDARLLDRLLGHPDDEVVDKALTRRKKLFAIEDPKVFHAAAKAFLEKHALPDDARLLDRLLGHPDDEVVDKALTRLEELHKAGALKAPPALSTRLSSVEIESGDPRIRKRAAELRKAIR